MVGVIAVPIAYLSYVKINEIRKKANKEKSVTMKLPTKKTIVGLLSSTGLVLSIVMMIISYSPEQYLDFLYNRKCKYGCIVIPC
jgi:hypothetical protein